MHMDEIIEKTNNIPATLQDRLDDLNTEVEISIKELVTAAIKAA
jgi:hypothetical protein